VAQKVSPSPASPAPAPAAPGGKNKRWLLAAAGLGLAGAGFVAVPLWRRHALVARVQAALPPAPTRTGMPPVLLEQLAAAETAARSSSYAEALTGVATLGRLYHANGLTREAEACWRVLHDAQSGEPRWTYYLANLRRAASDYPAMEAFLEQTVRQAPDYTAAWWQLAELKFKTGRLEAAQADYNRRLALLPQDPYARLGLARIALLQHRPADARLLLEQLLKDNPKFPTAHNLYVDMLAAEGNTAEIAQHRLAGRDTGRFHDPADPWLKELQDWCYDYRQLCNLGTIEFQTVPGPSYQAFFERAIKLRPGEPTAYEQLGIIHLELNEPDKAREVLETGLARAKDSPPSILYYANLSRAYRSLKRPADAVRIVRQGLAEAGDHFELYDALGSALGDLGEYEAAVEALHAAVARNPSDANANYNLALALLPVHRLDEAVEALHRSLTLQPTFPSSLGMLAQIEIDSGRWRDAAQYIQPLYESHPELPQSRQLMAYWYLQAGKEAEAKKDLPAAEQHYRAGATIEPNHPELQSRLGTLCLIQGRFADAVAPLEAYHRLQPNNAQSALFLGQAYASTGQTEQAKRVLTEGVQAAERAGNATTAQYCREILQQLP
jgi:HemY protein